MDDAAGNAAGPVAAGDGAGYGVDGQARLHAVADKSSRFALSEAVEFFWTCAVPAGEQHDSGLRVLVTVAMPEVTSEILVTVADLS